MLGVRFISHRPHDYARMILVPCNHLAQHLLVVLSDVEGLVRVDLISRADSDRRRLIDHDDTLSVAQLIHLLRIRIVAGAERIGIQPVDQIDILDIQAHIESSSTESRILVFSKALKIERFSIDQKLRSLYRHRADAECLLVEILPVSDTRRIEVRLPRPRPPQSGIRDSDCSARSIRRCHLIAVRVQNTDAHLILTYAARRLNLIIYHSGIAVNIRHQRNVLNISRRRRIDADRTVDSRIIKEIKIRQILRFSPYLRRFNTRHARIVRSEKCRAALISDRKRAVIYPVVRRNDELRRLSRHKLICHIHLKRKKAAFMRSQKSAI